MTKGKTDNDIKDIIKDKTDILQKYILNNCIDNDPFSGPARYFPRKALECCRNKFFLSDRHIEMIYATLTAWGMHRLGEKGAEMPDYKCFKCSILRCKSDIEELKSNEIDKLTEIESTIKDLQDLAFNKIRASETNSRLVSSTKVLAHILPDLVPPMDWNYTGNFFGYKYTDSYDKQSQIFKNVMRTLWQVYQDEKVLEKASKYHGISLPKLFDNAIIQIRRDEEEKKKKGLE